MKYLYRFLFSSLYLGNNYTISTLSDYSLIARFFEISPFEPWLTRDKVDRVSEGQPSVSSWGMFPFVFVTFISSFVLKGCSNVYTSHITAFWSVHWLKFDYAELISD